MKRRKVMLLSTLLLLSGTYGIPTVRPTEDDGDYPSYTPGTTIHHHHHLPCHPYLRGDVPRPTITSAGYYKVFSPPNLPHPEEMEFRPRIMPDAPLLHQARPDINQEMAVVQRQSASQMAAVVAAAFHKVHSEAFSGTADCFKTIGDDYYLLSQRLPMIKKEARADTSTSRLEHDTASCLNSAADLVFKNSVNKKLVEIARGKAHNFLVDLNGVHPRTKLNTVYGVI